MGKRVRKVFLGGVQGRKVSSEMFFSGVANLTPIHVGVSKNRGKTPKSFIFIGFSMK